MSMFACQNKLWFISLIVNFYLVFLFSKVWQCNNSNIITATCFYVFREGKMQWKVQKVPVQVLISQS